MPSKDTRGYPQASTPRTSKDILGHPRTRNRHPKTPKDIRGQPGTSGQGRPRTSKGRPRTPKNTQGHPRKPNDVRGHRGTSGDTQRQARTFNNIKGHPRTPDDIWGHPGATKSYGEQSTNNEQQIAPGRSTEHKQGGAIINSGKLWAQPGLPTRRTNMQRQPCGRQ